MVVIAAAHKLAHICDRQSTKTAPKNLPVEVVLLRVVKRFELLLGDLNVHGFARHFDLQKLVQRSRMRAES